MWSQLKGFMQMSAETHMESTKGRQPTPAPGLQPGRNNSFIVSAHGDSDAATTVTSTHTKHLVFHNIWVSACFPLSFLPHMPITASVHNGHTVHTRWQTVSDNRLKSVRTQVCAAGCQVIIQLDPLWMLRKFKNPLTFMFGWRKICSGCRMAWHLGVALSLLLLPEYLTCLSRGISCATSPWSPGCFAFWCCPPRGLCSCCAQHVCFRAPHCLLTHWSPPLRLKALEGKNSALLPSVFSSLVFGTR